MSEKIIFTICSLNYIGQASTLMESIENEETRAYRIILVCDKKNNKIVNEQFHANEVLFVEDLGIENFERMSQNYNIIELNTSVKPFVFSWLMEKYRADLIYYLDPDIYLYNNFIEIDKKLANTSYVLTPHILKPIGYDNNFNPNENVFLKFGVYNLGFLGVNTKHSNTKKLIQWWCDRLNILCYNRPHDGLFVDQLWFDLAVVLFKDHVVLGHFGMNVAPWNFHERKIIKINNDLSIENGDKLIFIHFSNIVFPDFKKKTKSYNRFKNGKSDTMLLTALYEDYFNKLDQNEYSFYSGIKPQFGLAIIRSNKKTTIYKRLKKTMKSIFRYIRVANFNQ